MEVQFVRAFRWYRRDEVVDVPTSVAKLWEMMGHVRRVPPKSASAAAAVAIETAEMRAVPETAMVAVLPQRKRRGRGNELPKPDPTE